MAGDKVVFIRGTGRCGSKNLVDHLGQHPELAHVPVNQVLPEELIDWSRSCLQASDPRISDAAIAAACRGYFAGYGRAMAGRDGILLQKSTRNAHHLATLLEYWPESRIVYLVRHPIGVVEALVNATMHDEGGRDYGYPAGVADSLLQWYNEIQSYLKSSAFGHPRVLQVRFEDLVADPPRTVSGICRFLGIGAVALPPYGGPELYDAPFVLNESERRWIIDSSEDVLTRLGYAGFEPARDGRPASEDAIDRYAGCRLKTPPPALDASELTRIALRQAARIGHRRVGLFGAGYFARLACADLTELPVEVPCIFDENPKLARTRIGSLPVRTPDAAPEIGVDAVIPTTFVHQEKLMQRWRRLLGDAVPILPLWDEDGLE